jgi:hypothetical protein
MPTIFVIALGALTFTSLIAAVSYWRAPQCRFLSRGVLITAAALVAWPWLIGPRSGGEGWDGLGFVLVVLQFDMIVGTVHLMFFAALLISWLSVSLWR